MIETRTLTPERWLISVLRRARCVISATICFMKSRVDDLDALGLERTCLGLHDLDLVLERARIVGANLGAEAILQRRDDAPAIGVVLRVGAGDHEDVQRQANLVAANLYVALFHDVEQTDLDALGEVGQLVDAEDATIGARDQTVVDASVRPRGSAPRPP